MIAGLAPQFVVAGQKSPGAGDEPQAIEQTPAYLKDAQHILATVSSPEEYYAAIVRKYPYRMNLGLAW